MVLDTKGSKLSESEIETTGKIEIDVPSAPEATESQLLVEKLFKRIPYLVSDYRQLIKHTGGMMTASMGYAYQKGLNDALKLLIKEMKQ